MSTTAYVFMKKQEKYYFSVEKSNLSGVMWIAKHHELPECLLSVSILNN